MAAIVDVSCGEGVRAPLATPEIEAIVRGVLEAEGIVRPCLISLSIVGDGRMRELNLAWRGVDRATDVLSLECERPDDPDLAEGEPCELGDVVLAPAYIAAQAERVGSSERDEFALLLIHGLLHLLGYDHLGDDEATVMEAREDALLAKLVGPGVSPVITTRHRADGEP